MNRSILCLLLFSSLAMACASKPAAVVDEPPAVQQIPAEEPPAPAPAPAVEEAPAAVAVDQDMYDKTLAEVKAFIDGLNKAIAAKNYNSWRASLSDTYFAEISSPEFLEKASESPLLKNRKIVLKTPNDYFTNVVVPARANSQVDEIEFVDYNNIKAYYHEARTRKDENNQTVTETRRLRLYELTKSGDTWKIAN